MKHFLGFSLVLVTLSLALTSPVPITVLGTVVRAQPTMPETSVICRGTMVAPSVLLSCDLSALAVGEVTLTVAAGTHAELATPLARAPTVTLRSSSSISGTSARNASTSAALCAVPPKCLRCFALLMLLLTLLEILVQSRFAPLLEWRLL